MSVPHTPTRRTCTSVSPGPGWAGSEVSTATRRPGFSRMSVFMFCRRDSGHDGVTVFRKAAGEIVVVDRTEDFDDARQELAVDRGLGVGYILADVLRVGSADQGSSDVGMGDGK